MQERGRKMEDKEKREDEGERNEKMKVRKEEVQQKTKKYTLSGAI